MLSEYRIPSVSPAASEVGRYLATCIPDKDPRDEAFTIKAGDDVLCSQSGAGDRQALVKALRTLEELGALTYQRLPRGPLAGDGDTRWIALHEDHWVWHALLQLSEEPLDGDQEDDSFARRQWADPAEAVA